MAGNDPMTRSSPGVKLTYDDFVQFPDDGLRHELIDGEHYVTPSPNTKHQSVSINLTVLIGELARTAIQSGASFTHRSTWCSPGSTWSNRICSISRTHARLRH